MGAHPPCLAAQGFAAQGLAEQGFAAHGFAAQGLAAQGRDFLAFLAFFALAAQGLALHACAAQALRVPEAAAGADAMARPPATVNNVAILANLLIDLSSRT